MKEREPVLYFDSGQSIFVLGIYWMRILVIVLPIYRVCVSVHTCVCVYVRMLVLRGWGEVLVCIQIIFYGMPTVVLN